MNLLKSVEVKQSVLDARKDLQHYRGRKGYIDALLPASDTVLVIWDKSFSSFWKIDDLL